jgi:hypothetical protein
MPMAVEASDSDGPVSITRSHLAWSAGASLAIKSERYLPAMGKALSSAIRSNSSRRVVVGQMPWARQASSILSRIWSVMVL